MECMTCGTYSIQNNINGKSYSGSSTDVKKRWKTHKRTLRKGNHHSIKLQRAWDKYGEDSFIFVFHRPCLKENLLTHEQHLIDSTNSYHQGYNASKEAYRIVISKSKRIMAARKAGPKLSSDAKKQWADPIIRKKMVDGIRKAAQSKEHRKNLSKALKGRVIDDKWKRNMSKARKKLVIERPDLAQNHSKAMQDKFKNDEDFRQRHKKGVNKRWKDPEERRKASEKAKKQMLRRGISQIIEFNGITDTITGWSERLNMSKSNIKHRLKRGYPLEVVLNPNLMKVGRKKRAI